MRGGWCLRWVVVAISGVSILVGVWGGVAAASRDDTGSRYGSDTAGPAASGRGELQVSGRSGEPREPARTPAHAAIRKSPTGDVEGEKRSSAAVGRAATSGTPAIEITPAREAAALTFAREHHPELVRLLQALRKVDRQQYLKAVRELYRQSERLARMKERGDWRYDLALQSWIVDSRLQVLSARYATTEDERLLPRIRELIRERRMLQLQTMVRERERLESRLKKLNEAIDRLNADMDRSVEDELQRVVRKARMVAAGQRMRSKKQDAGNPAKQTQTRRQTNDPEAGRLRRDGEGAPKQDRPRSTKSKDAGKRSRGGP
ncbi:MAG: hypothetical protein D6725_13855 [Planctomycetota bacterium]|nr:MAG: hypothetical protein D6725_13855 [Planctomycetota bacterium]